MNPLPSRAFSLAALALPRDWGEGSLLTLPVADLLLGSGVDARRVGEHALHDLELRNIHGHGPIMWHNVELTGEAPQARSPR